jgi:signal transduction histidine kinase
MNIKKDAPESTTEILIVEDSPTQAELLKYLLEQHDCKVLTANNGKQALALLDKHKPALVISDIVMPEMDGYELCRQIKSNTATEAIPVILLTSLANAEDVLEGLACGADNFITKPYSEDYLLSSIQRILANKKLHKGERVRVGVEILFAGKKRFITADQQQMLTLLISTYEAAVQKNKELAQTQEKLRSLNEHLDNLVKERTAELTNEVAERKRAEAKAEVLARFPSENPNPVLRIALDGTLLYINMAGTDQLEEWNLHEGQKTPSFLQEVVTEAITRGLTQVLDLEHSKRVYSFFIAPVGACGYANLYGRDTTERNRAENQINRLNQELLQKNDELEQLIYVASHDLRSPLVNVQGFTKEIGLLANELAEITSHAGLPDKQQARIVDIVSKEFPEARNYILASVVKMDGLLKGLLKFSRLGRASVNLQKIDMNEMLSGVLKTMEFQVQQCAARVETTALPPCTGDPVQVDQVFTNLIDNALKYLDPDRAGIIRITGKAKNGISEYCVEDNGIGIAPQHQSKAFEIFHRLNPQASEGEGLGLAIVKKIVSRLNGNVRLESEVGKGSRFIVTLPEG